MLAAKTPAGNPLGVAALPGCVPLDIFGPGTLNDDPDGAGPLQPGAMTSFIRVNTFTDVKVEENRIAGYIRGDLFELPAGPIAAVFGFEYRDTFAAQVNDNEQRTGNIFGFNAMQDTSRPSRRVRIVHGSRGPAGQRSSVRPLSGSRSWLPPFELLVGRQSSTPTRSVANGRRLSGCVSATSSTKPPALRTCSNCSKRATKASRPIRILAVTTGAGNGVPDLNENGVTPDDDVIQAQCTAIGVVYPGFAPTTRRCKRSRSVTRT